MTRHTRTTSALGAACAAAVLAGLTLPFGPAASAFQTVPRPGPTAETPATPAAAGATHRITLVTGDVVTVTDGPDGTGAVTIDRSTDPSDAIRTQTIGHDLYVIPDVAMPYIAAGRLDRALFDVTTMIADGYDDAHSPVIPLIVEYARSATSTKAAVPTGSSRSLMLRSIGGAALSATKRHAESFWSDVTPTKVSPVHPTFENGIARIYLDGKVHATLADSVAQIGAPEAWADGFDGTGATVAVLDTGIDEQHPDLVGQVTSSTSFVPGETVDDYNGHGTHVASTIAGTGAASDGVEKGVAPGADLVIGKVLGNDGSGQDSWIIDGMEWAAAHADVVNMSLGSSESSDGTDPVSQALDSLSESTGTLFVVAAGNAGAPRALGFPGAADDALTLGAVDGTDQLAWFSSMGPRIGNGGLKPDITAPGVDILAARSQYVAGEGPYQTMSGTSMATPHVAGAAAIIAEAHPGWSGAEIKDALMSTAHGLDGYTPYEVGTGRVDVPAALGDVHASGSRSFGFLTWPNADATPITRTITYTNDSAQPVTIDLTADVSDQNGTPVPDGLLTLGASQVTVAAHDTQSVQATADPSLAAAGSTISGTIVGSIGGQPLTRTSVGLVKESERYDVTITAEGRDGLPAQTYVTVHSFDDSYLDWVLVNGQTTVRLPANTYSLMAFMDVTDGPDSTGIALLGSPELTVAHDETLDLDASQAVPVTASVPQTTQAVFRNLEYYSGTSVPLDESLIAPDTVDNLYAEPTAQVQDSDFEFVTRWRLRSPMMQVVDGTQTLDVTQQIASGWLDGSSSLPAVYAGTGTPADYQGLSVTGKAVVIMRSPGVTMYDAARVAAKRGAAYLLVVNDAPGEFIDYMGGPNGERVDLPVGSISGAEGASVIDQAKEDQLTLELSGGMNSPWVYDLVDPHGGAIPDDLSYTPSRSELARISTRFDGVDSRVGGEFRWSYRPQTQYSMGFLMYARVPATRVDWVSTQPGTQWAQNAMVLKGTWDVRGAKTAYDAGDRDTQSWFDPVVLPRLGEGFWGPVRQNNYLQINLPSFGDAGDGHTGAMGSHITHQQIRLYQGKRLLDSSSGWQSMSSKVRGKLTTYRVTSGVRRDPHNWKTSTAIHSEYVFSTERATEPVLMDPLLPFIQMNFDVATDMAGDARAGHSDRIGLTGWQLPDVTLGGAIAGARLAVSYDDGKTWRALNLTGSTGDWHAHLTYPDDPSRFVSLRASVWDDAGNRATQEVIRAYGLR